VVVERFSIYSKEKTQKSM